MGLCPTGDSRYLGAVGGWRHFKLLSASHYALLILFALVFLVDVVVPLINLSFVLMLIEVGLVSTDTVRGTVRCSCARFGVALQLCGRVGGEDLRWLKR